MVQDIAEPRRRRLKRRRRVWPKWLRSKHLIRWLMIFGPHAYRLWRLVNSLRGTEDG